MFLLMNGILLQVTSVIKHLTLWCARVVVTELVQELVLVSVVPVGNLTIVFRVPLVLLVVLVGTIRYLELCVLVVGVLLFCHFL